METTEIATKADLLQVKSDILTALSEVMTRSSIAQKKWLKSNEVMELLGLSSSGLQNLRIRGTIPFTKLGGVIYYDYQEIMNLLDSNKRNPV
jgi:hypothetical protein